MTSTFRLRYHCGVTQRLAILVGGGPAPGINSVISAATIRGRLEGVEVVGVRDGFEWIMKGNVEKILPLEIEQVSRIHFRGGSHIGIARANPTQDPKLLETAVQSLLRSNVSMLITIGGDDTAFSAMKLEEKAGGRLRVVHVPKTIDNDLDLPPDVDTFGFQTARHYGVEIIKNLMVDAKTTTRWYFVIAMGRKAGHLALGMGKAAGATLTLIPEEFAGRQIKVKTIVDTLVGAILKRLSHGRRDGVAVIAEGLVLDLGSRGSRPTARRRARRARPRATRRSEHRRNPEGRSAGSTQRLRGEDDDCGEEHRVRAALRGSGADGSRIHPRPGLLRRQVPP